MASLLLLVSALWLYSRDLPIIPYHTGFELDTLQLSIAIAYSLIGSFIARRKPENVIGLIFCAMGFFSALFIFSINYALYSYFVIKTPLPFAGLMSWLQTSVWIFPFVLFVLIIFLYPNGQVFSPRWRWLPWTAFAIIPLLLLLTFIFQWPFRGPLMMISTNEAPPSSMNVRLFQMLSLPLIFLLFFVFLPLSVLSLIFRYRQGGNIERQQIKWFMYAGAVFGIVLIIYFLFAAIRPDLPQISNLLWYGLLPFVAIELPLAVAFAILRHRLFDIDLIIRRTLIYAALTVDLAIVYFLTVIGLQALMRSVIGQNSPVAIVLSTLVIVALFSPLHQRIQRGIDRRFYRAHYNQERVLSAMSAISQYEVDIERLTSALISTVDEAIHPEGLSLWIRKQ